MQKILGFCFIEFVVLRNTFLTIDYRALRNLNTYLPFIYGTLPYHLATVILPMPKTELRKLKT